MKKSVVLDNTLIDKLKALKIIKMDVTLTYLASVMGTLNEWDERRRRKRKGTKGSE